MARPPKLPKGPVRAIFRPVDAGPPDETDVFCIPNIDPATGDELGGILTRTRHFDIRASAFPLAPGHILITPRDHILTMGDVPVAWYPELEACANWVRQFHEDAYNQHTFTREQGSPLVRQAARHAHLHLVPVSGVVVLGRVPQAREVKSLLGVARYRAKHGGYHFVESNGKRLVMPDEGDGVARAEWLLCDALGSVWDPVKLQPTKMTPQQSVAPVAELKAKWSEWSSTAPRPRHRAFKGSATLT